MRILYLGSGHPAESALKEIVKEFKVEGLILSRVPQNVPSKSSTSEGVIKIAKKNNIPVYLSSNLEIIKKIKPDLVIVNNFRDIIPAKYVKRYKIINIHYSLLPKYRGMHSTQWAFINNEPYVGYSIYWMDENVDAGDIIFQQKIKVEEKDDINTLYKKLNTALASSICKVLWKIHKGTAKRVKQDTMQATYVQQRQPDDGLIDWNQNSRYIFNLVRALAYPYPRAYTFFKKNKIMIRKASMYSSPNYYEIPGHVVALIKNKGALVKTGDNVLCVEDLEIENGKIVKADKYFKRPGVRLKND